MKKLRLLTLLTCSSTPASQAQRHSDSAVGSKIAALENLWNHATQAKEANALDRILDDTFVNVTSEGRLLTKADVLVDVKASSNRFVITFGEHDRAFAWRHSGCHRDPQNIRPGPWQAVCPTGTLCGYLALQKRFMGFACEPGHTDRMNRFPQTGSGRNGSTSRCES